MKKLAILRKNEYLGGILPLGIIGCRCESRCESEKMLEKWRGGVVY